MRLHSRLRGHFYFSSDRLLVNKMSVDSGVVFMINFNSLTRDYTELSE